MLVLRIVGKSSQVFAALAVLSRKAGQLTIGEIVRLNRIKAS
jgi:hypothetical protein